MSKFKTKFSLTKILLSLSILTLVVIGCLSQVHNAKAANLAACGLLRNTCQSGSVVLNPDSRVFNSLTRCYDWICRFDNEVACSECPSKCGNGQIDSGEECDGALLNNQTCTSRGFTGGTLSCNGSCQFDESKCTNGTLCGNNQIDSGEDCDGSNLNGQTCISRGYDGGTLGCYPFSCLFDESACTSISVCGNGVREGSERCDGSDFGLSVNDEDRDGQITCKDFGYNGGALSCRDNCYFNLENCYNCDGDGVLDVGEECDGFDFGGKTCSTFGCQAGGLSCSLECKIIKNCSSCETISQDNGCQKTVKSTWSNPAKLIKPCCGSDNNTIVSSLLDSSAGLCAGGKAPSGFAPVYNATTGVLLRWEWKCGSETCKAYKQAECGSDVSTEIDSSDVKNCSKGKIFSSKNNWLTARKNRIANGDKDQSPLCEGGSYSKDAVCPWGDSAWTDNNESWYCSGEAPSGQTNRALCATGWADDSECGPGAGLYPVPAGVDCRKNAFWDLFMVLGTYKDSNYNNILCAKGSKVFNATESMAYWEAEKVSTDPIAYWKEAWSPMSTSKLPKYFSWQCLTSDTRLGEPIDCRAKLDVSACKMTAYDAACGLALLSCDID
jgi:hypothetical protein